MGDILRLVVFVLDMFSSVAMNLCDFPSPWSIRRTAGGYCVDTATGITVAYVYFVEGFRRHFDGRALTDEEARWIAVQIARLPDLMKG
jgi:hypothetical protein